MWRSFAIETIAVVAFLALPGAALAAGPQEGPNPSRTRDVRAAGHVGELTNDRMVWRSRYAVHPVDPETASRIAFVRPLPEETEVVETSPPGATLVRNGSGRPTAVRVPAPASDREEVSLVVRHGFDAESGLQPPFAGERTDQRVALQGLHYSPADDSGLRSYPGHMATEHEGTEAGESIEGYLGEPPGEREHLIYARPTDLAGARLSGAFTSDESHRRRVVFLLGGVLVVLGVLIGGAYKWLEGRAKEERAEAILEEYGGSSDDPWEGRL